jgi:hypothetical protein
VFSPDGAYVGELVGEDRLAVDPAKRERRAAPFTHGSGWVGTAARARRPPLPLPSRFEDFA